MARAIWKGILQVGADRVPVKLYSAVEDRSVHFRLLAGRKHEPVQQQLVDPESGEIVPYAEVQRGFALRGAGQEGFVVLRKEELDELVPEGSREIALSRFIARGKLGPEWQLRPYYLGPDGDDASYFALAEALASEGKEGLAHWTMRRHEYTGLLRPLDGYLTLTTLRHAEEVIARKELPRPEGRAHSDKELKMAEQLIAAFSDDFDPAQYRDEYRERVLAFVEAKAKGKRPRLKHPQPKPAAESLSQALAKSLEHAKKERRVA